MTQDEFVALKTKAEAAISAYSFPEMPAATRYSPDVLQRVGAAALDLHEFMSNEQRRRNSEPTPEETKADEDWFRSHPPVGLTEDEWNYLVDRPGCMAS